ncbi:Regulator of sirC expression, contains transglutaminase-like and TPR domains [Azotobacter beijerinckii]|uniref:Regulator of sirC expression, contains transglutaminase-like and TPR domains n=1 Tax=Azotobacter beijerinckii TaxID=170623 RepID=A0A1H9BMK9_9GAMM|nr:transglutaminase family protein [Azotobacter beijerinckii]SEP90182.1 Regulator of sirC expression, contains transglutaminase-like and TPR domains [Azotobacter beijerinckii]
MNSRQACFACLQRDPPATFEAALWIATEHDPALRPELVLREVGGLAQQVAAALPGLPLQELGQPLLRQLHDLGFHEEDHLPLRPPAALLHKVLQQRRGHPLALALIALEVARYLEIPLYGVDFPGHFLLRMESADHLLDPVTGRRLYTRDCRDLLVRQIGAQVELEARHLQPCAPHSLLQQLSRQLRQTHLQDDDHLAALKDAERVLLLGPPSVADHLVRADLYQRLECPLGERFDLQRALLLCDDPAQRLQLSQRLRQVEVVAALH